MVVEKKGKRRDGNERNDGNIDNKRPSNQRRKKEKEC